MRARRPRLSPSAATGAALAATALCSGLQALLFLDRFGANTRTDGVIAGYSAYALVVVAGQILRTSAVPLLGGDRPRLRRGTFAAAILLLAAVAALVFGLLARPAADALLPAAGVADARRRPTPCGSSPRRWRFDRRGRPRDSRCPDARMARVAAAYGVSAGVGLAAFVVVAPRAGVTSLAWAALGASVALVAGLVVAAPPRGARPRLGGVASAVPAVVGTAAVRSPSSSSIPSRSRSRPTRPRAPSRSLGSRSRS